MPCSSLITDIGIKEENLIPGIEDNLFKTLFTSSEYKEFISYIISNVIPLNKEYIKANMKVLNTNSRSLNKKNKRCVTDILLQVDNNIINIECNRWLHAGLIERNCYYLSSIIKNSINVNEKYNKYNFYQININNFNLNNTKDVVNKYQIADLKTSKVLTDNFQIIEITLDNIRKKWYNNCKLTKFEKYLYSISSINKEELDKLSKEDREIEKVVKLIMKYNSDNKWEDFFDYEFDEKVTMNTIVGSAEEKIRKESKEEGIKEGERKGILSTIVNMLKKGLSFDLISECTGSSVEEIKQISLNIE